MLVCDDNAMLRGSVARLLRRHGYDVVEAETGAEALLVLEVRSPDVLLLDYDLPDIEGTELLYLLEDQGMSVPTIFLSGHPHTRVAPERLRGHGVRAWLSKPFASKDLLGVIACAAARESGVSADFDGITEERSMADPDGMREAS